MAIFNEMLGGGVNAKGCNATAADILSGKTAAVGKNIVTGTMTNNGAVSKTITGGSSYTIPKGYHNGSGKVTADGVKINGVIGDYLVCAGQSVSAGDFVEYISGQFIADKQLSSTSMSGLNICALALTPQTVLIVYTYAYNNLYGVVCTFNGNDVTVGTPVTLHSIGARDSASNINLCKLSDTKAVLVYQHYNGGSNNDDIHYSTLYGIVCTVSGTSLSVGSIKNIKQHSDTGDHLIGVNYSKTLSSSKIIVFYTRNYEINGMVCTVSGTSITVGTVTNITSSSDRYFLHDCCALSETSVLISGLYSSKVYGLICTVNNTTITVNPATSMTYTVYSNSDGMKLVKLSNSKVFVVFSDSSSSYPIKTAIYTINGTSITSSTPIQISTSGGNYLTACLASPTLVLVFYNSALNMIECTVSGNTITAGTSKTLISTSGSGTHVDASSDGVVFIAHSSTNSSSAKLNLLVRKSDGVQKKSSGEIIGVAKSSGSSGAKIPVYIP